MKNRHISTICVLFVSLRLCGRNYSCESNIPCLLPLVPFLYLCPMHFPVSLTLRIDWSELDLFGHVNNVAYFKYIQASRVNYWEAIGLYRMYEQQRIGPMLASASCDFRQPLYYPGIVIIQARMEFIKNTSFGFHHRLLAADGSLAAEAHDVMVMYDFNKMEKVGFPEEIRRKVEEVEGK